MDQRRIEEDVHTRERLVQSNIDDACKQTMLRLLDVAAIMSNCATTDEKISKIIDTLHEMAISQVAFLGQIDDKIENANRRQCTTCKAIKIANEIEEERRNKEIIEKWQRQNGESREGKSSQKAGWIKQVFQKPWIWMFGCALAVSPYGVELLQTILKAFGR